MDALDEADRLEHIEMMGEKVGSELEELTEFDRGPVAAAKGLDDAEPHRIPERGMEGCTSGDRGAGPHGSTLARSAISVNEI